MTTNRVLAMTDIVDSTQLHAREGDAVMAEAWTMHDAAARELIRRHRGLEIGRSDGFLVLFESASEAGAFALGYHAALARLSVPMRARVGLHAGPVTLRENRAEDTCQGATPFEVDGVALPVTARVMSLALAGQTLATAPVADILSARGLRVMSHGHWRLKGIAEPVELFETGEGDAPFIAPPGASKAYRVVLRGDLWVTLQHLPHNLPAERDSFVGRGDALKAVDAAFEEGARLVTVMGTGGVGKSRLALAYARAWLGDYPGGVWFCDLNAARSADGIVHAVAQSLQLPASARDPVEQIGDALAGREACLVILDTFEQVARHAEKTIGAWLERAPAVRFLVTSRELLGIVGEHAQVLAPLTGDEAQALFRQRVRAAGLPSLLPPADEVAIAPLMTLLDCLPLAIELAAARARVMLPAVMLQRMDDRFKLLSRRGERHDRQNTLRATLDWSWALLCDEERTALMQLSVFEGGIALEAAEAVIEPALAGADAWVPDLLQALIEKSLLRPASAQRFELLRAVQDYAAERLAESAGQGAAHERHWRWFAGLTEVEAADRRGEEAENVVVACRRAAGRDLAPAIALLRNAWAVLRLTGPFSVAAGLAIMLDAVVPTDHVFRVDLDLVRGAVCRLGGEVAQARAAYERALARAVRAGGEAAVARVRCQLAQLELSSGDAAAAERLLREVERSPVLGLDPELHITCLNGLGQVQIQRAGWSTARRCFADALALAEQAADRRWQGGLHGNLGLVARAEGRREDARTHWQTALHWASEVGDRQWAGNDHCNLGFVLHELGDEAGARRELTTALDIARGIGHPRLEATALCNLGLVEEARGDPVAAGVHHGRAAQVAESLGDRRLEGQARGYLGLALAGAGRHEGAAGELARARDLLQPLEDPSAMALVLLQTAVARSAAGEGEAAEAALDEARAWMARSAEGVDAEVGAMLGRAEQALARVVDRV